MRHRAAARAAPPVALRVGGDKRAQRAGVIHVEALDGDVIGIAIGGLDLVHVEARREEQHRFAVRGDEGLIDIGRHPAGAGENAQGGRFQQGKIAVAPAHLDDRLHVERVAIAADHRAIVDGPHFELVSRVDELIALIIAGAVAQHGQRLVHPHHNGGAQAAGEPLHLHFDIADGDAFRRNPGGQIMRIPAVGVALPGKHREHIGNIGEVFIAVPAAAHALDIQLESCVVQTLSVKNAHILVSLR